MKDEAKPKKTVKTLGCLLYIILFVPIIAFLGNEVFEWDEGITIAVCLAGGILLLGWDPSKKREYTDDEIAEKFEEAVKNYKKKL